MYCADSSSKFNDFKVHISACLNCRVEKFIFSIVVAVVKLRLRMS